MGLRILKVIALVVALATATVGAIALFSDSTLGSTAASLAALTAALTALYVIRSRRRSARGNE